MLVNNFKLEHIYNKEVQSPSGKRRELTVGEGIGVRISAKGKFTWQCRYRLNGKQHRLDLGSYPELSYAKAMEKHAQIQGQVRNGSDPKGNLDAEIKTVEQLCSYWMEHWCRRNRKRPDLPEHSIDKDIIPKIGQKSLSTIRPLDIHTCINVILERGSTSQALKTFALLKQIFTYGESLEIVPKNPTRALTKALISKPPVTKSRALADEEIGTLLVTLDSCILSEPFTLWLLILLYTGQRRNELRLAEWSHICLKEGTWRIPADNNKSAREHIVYLSEPVKRFFEKLKALAGDSNWVLPSINDPELCCTERVLTRAVARNHEKFGIARFTPHNLRTTFVTRLNNLTGTLHVTEKIVNHSLEGMLRIYDRGEYEEQKKKSMALWAKHLEKLKSKAALEASNLLGVENAAE